MTNQLPTTKDFTGHRYDVVTAETIRDIVIDLEWLSDNEIELLILELQKRIKVEF